MTVATWAAFVVVTAVSSLSPGPAVLFVLSQGMADGARGWRSAIVAIETTNAVYFALSALGVGALLATSHTAFTVIRYVGAAYLVGLGIRTIRSRQLPTAVGSRNGGSRVGMSTFWRGVTLQASNPKAILYFAALLPQFVDPHRPAVSQLVVLATTDIVIEVTVLAAYGTLATRTMTVATRPGFSRVTSRLSGAVLILAGIVVALRSG